MNNLSFSTTNNTEMTKSKFAADITDAVLSLFHLLPAKGKPALNQVSEFTVLAAIVAVIDTSDGYRSFVISIATGTKCIGNDELNKNTSGCLLHDSHAEVLTRRGFNMYLLNCIRFLTGCSSENVDDHGDNNFCALQWNRGSQLAQLKPGWKFYLYSSDSPCGSSSMYCVKSFNSSTTLFLNSTGAKPIKKTFGHPMETCCSLGELRTKSGRSDILSSRQTTSMSCSDKVSRWFHLGLQGAFLSAFLSEPIPLSGIVIGKDPLARAEDQKAAAQLAFNRGIVEPEIYIAPESDEYLFLRSKAMVKYSIATVYKEEELPTNNASENTPGSESSGPRKEVDESKETRASSIATQGKDVSNRKRKRHGHLAESNLNSHRPCGSSLNWIISMPSATPSRSGTVEVTIASSGLLQGATMKSRNDDERAHKDMIRCSSRLCRQRFAQLFVDTVKSIRKNPFRVPHCSSDSNVVKQICNDGDRKVPSTDEFDKSNDGEKGDVIPTDCRPYRWWKDAYSSDWYVEGKRKFLESANFREWLRSDPTMGSNAALILSATHFKLQ